MFLLMAQELNMGWKVYDYVAYQDYRFQVREKRWQMAAWDTLDESIAEPLQAIDMMCFSSQFYFMTTLLAWGNMTSMFGISIILRFTIQSICRRCIANADGWHVGYGNNDKLFLSQNCRSNRSCGLVAVFKVQWMMKSQPSWL